ncbi:MAG: UDP-N-acetylglucosamine 2-epimerase (non-hydrolyzing) [Candidatus Thermoplasmatota archaeon]|nr:UDP-N-acetylglucosamine 2-epimerase (non-hydrolyzing) [Candidatus Thermoplasmatota archaeon]
MLSIVLGTRPEIIKMAPVIRYCEESEIPYHILHTGQHYSYSMDRTFFEQLELPNAHFNLDVGSGTHGAQTGKILEGIEKVLMKSNVDEVLVQGDTNTVMAGALAATKLHIKVGHVEAGLRSFDRTMPEEINRIVSDHISDHLFPPTENSKRFLLDEGIDENRIFVCGNTIVDSVMQNLELSKDKVDPLKDLDLQEKGFALVTAHRAENVDDMTRFKNIIAGLRLFKETSELKILYPIHPRARKFLEKFKIDTTGIDIVEPVGFLEFLQLESSAKVVLTDSGGVQEETCILRTPCVTLRDNTERPETVDVGSNIIAGTLPDDIERSAVKMMGKNGDWESPFGDGTAGKQIVDICLDRQ